MPDITLILLAALLAVMIFFTWRNSRKRKAEAENLQSQIVPGAEVMTQHGIYGTLISIDEDKNEAIIETTPGTQLRVHRQTIARVVDPIEPEPADDEASDDLSDEVVDAEETAAEAVETSEPEFGERVAKPKRASRAKPSETAE
ncbi:preprotein translocase subunit YajC [Protaetiibacter larvae]|uniref:Preprotein translocase subunit YajC n=1 Tax=Protaetiibacter larvae TaxID=2592654 RepID=A0A5C1Y9Q8_9MICO|nr:preprotein translocase subunit YajC [Protaetiibacter larvae]QEO10148.1 preprotein translocase subunit YajC [Protaetiibacter larvae]